MMEENNNSNVSISVFNKYTKHNAIKVTLLSILIALVVTTAVYFFAKSQMDYTLGYELNGGILISGEDHGEYKFLERTQEPDIKIKKYGYYFIDWCADEDLTEEYEFGEQIWHSKKIYAKWEEGVALVLNFAEGEENSDLSLDQLKLLYENWYPVGTVDSLPMIYNTNENSVHYGERLVWFEDPECSGIPTLEKTYTLNTSVQLYGKWFDIEDDKFQVDEDGTLIKYLGYCKNIILPANILKIKDVDPTLFKYGNSGGQLNEQHGIYYSAFENVAGQLETIFINKSMKELGDCAFRGIDTLKYVVFLGDDVEEIGDYAFADCTSLKILTIPSKVTTISANCFHGATNLETVEIGSNVTTIEEKAFLNSGIKEIYLTNVTRIEKMAFAGCESLKTIVLASNSIISSNVTTPESGANCDNVFMSTADASYRLKIYVPSSLLAYYKVTSPWSVYTDYLYAISD